MAGKWRILAAEARICHGLAFCQFVVTVFAHAGVKKNALRVYQGLPPAMFGASPSGYLRIYKECD